MRDKRLGSRLIQPVQIDAGRNRPFSQRGIDHGFEDGQRRLFCLGGIDKWVQTPDPLNTPAVFAVHDGTTNPSQAGLENRRTAYYNTPESPGTVPGAVTRR